MTESMEPAHGLPAAGWYVDPLDAGVLRYWDGAAWTAHARPVEVEPEPARAQKHRLGLAAILGIIASTALLGVALVTIAALAQKEAMEENAAPPAVATTSAAPATDAVAPSRKVLAKRARADLEELGVTIVTAFIEHPDARMDVAEIDGDYVVLADGTEYARIDVSAGVQLGDYVAGDAEHFCVWVSIPATGRNAHWSPLDVADEHGKVDRSGDCSDVVG